MAHMLTPYGSSNFAKLVAKVGDGGKSLAPYGSQDNACLVAKASVGGGKSLAPYGAPDQADLVAKVGEGGKLASAKAQGQIGEKRLRIVRLNARQD